MKKLKATAAAAWAWIKTHRKASTLIAVAIGGLVVGRCVL